MLLGAVGLGMFLYVAVGLGVVWMKSL
jgi:hypothetical protein